MKRALTVFGFICSTLITQANGQNMAGSDKTESFDLSRIDASVVRQFSMAWQCSGLGMSAREGLVLVSRKADGSYLPGFQGCSNEFTQVSFRWRQDIIAIIHTHRNADDAKPSPQDELVADRFGVPIFTITRRGMFVYYPSTKKTAKVMNGLDWLQAGKFRSDIEGKVLSDRLHTPSQSTNERRTL